MDHRPRPLTPGPAGAAWCFLRHGESEDNAAGRISDDPDVRLTARGADEARRAGLALGGLCFARVLCSPHRRARDTAALAAPGPWADGRVDLLEWFAERRLGALAGPARGAEGARWRLSWTATPPGGESQAAVLERVRMGLRALRTGPAPVRPARGEPVLVVAHAGVLRAWLGWIDGVPADQRGALRVPRATPIWRTAPTPPGPDGPPAPG